MADQCIHCGGTPDRDREGRIVRWVIGYPGIAMPPHEHELTTS